jgi:hypothetical protein
LQDFENEPLVPLTSHGSQIIKNGFSKSGFDFSMPNINESEENSFKAKDENRIFRVYLNPVCQKSKQQTTRSNSAIKRYLFSRNNSNDSSIVRREQSRLNINEKSPIFNNRFISKSNKLRERISYKNEYNIKNKTKKLERILNGRNLTSFNIHGVLSGRTSTRNFVRGNIGK